MIYRPALLVISNYLIFLAKGQGVSQISAKPFIGYADSHFGPQMEGLGVDPLGNVLAMGYGSNQQEIGLVYPIQERIMPFISNRKQHCQHSASTHVNTTSTHVNTTSTQTTTTTTVTYRGKGFDAKGASYYRGMRFRSTSEALLIDSDVKQIMRIKLDMKSSPKRITKSILNCGDMSMLSINDLAVTRDDVIFSTGAHKQPSSTDQDGDLWMCPAGGGATKPAIKLDMLGPTSGIALSPDDHYLYVAESHTKEGHPVSQKIWRYTTQDLINGMSTSKQLWIDFEKIDPSSTKFPIRSLRTDVNGNLFITRLGLSQIRVYDPIYTQLIQVISLSFSHPTSLEFGGPKGSTLFVSGACMGTWSINRGCVDSAELVYPGSIWSSLN